MRVECPVSLGALVDKLSILRVKKKKISNDKKLQFIKDEEKQLNKLLDDLNLGDEISQFVKQLELVNIKLWDIEDSIRILERKQLFNEDFIEIARKVYHINDQRFEIKNIVNEKYNSEIREVKEYTKYKA